MSDRPSQQHHAVQYLINLGLRGMIQFALLFPYKYRIPLMGWLTARVVAPLAGYDNRVRDNLRTIFPELPEAEVEHLCRAVPDNAGRTLIELYSGRQFVDVARRAPILGQGFEDLKAAQNAGRPVILVGGHFGNYDAVRAKLISEGYAIGGLYRPLRNTYFNAHYVSSLKVIGEPVFEQSRRGLAQMIKHLRAGGCLFVLTDLHSVGGVYLDFFEKPARTSLGLAELALKYDAAMIPFFGKRCETGLDFEVILKPEIPHTDPQTMTQVFNRELEDAVRDNMDQWFWIHRRWKS